MTLKSFIAIPTVTKTCTSLTEIAQMLFQYSLEPKSFANSIYNALSLIFKTLFEICSENKTLFQDLLNGFPFHIQEL